MFLFDGTRSAILAFYFHSIMSWLVELAVRGFSRTWIVGLVGMRRDNGKILQLLHLLLDVDVVLIFVFAHFHHALAFAVKKLRSVQI